MGISQARAAREFSQRWAGRGEERSDTHTFWLDLLGNVLGMPDTHTNVRFEQRTAAAGWIDATIPGAKTMIEQKSLGVSLDTPELRQGLLVTPYQQAKRYADTLPNSERPDYIITCNFDIFRIHNLNDLRPEESYVQFQLAELAEQLYLLDFLKDPTVRRRVRQQLASIEAGVLVGKLYNLLQRQYVDPEAPQSQHSLNVLMVRLVFCLFAEDAGIFPRNALVDYFSGMRISNVRLAMQQLFRHLNTPPDDVDPYTPEELKRLPFVNGGLFTGDVEIPQFTEEIVHMLLSDISEGTDWSGISPTVFGGVFESTLNPAARASGGMHYTSEENIRRVIEPLFLDDLTAELETILRGEGVTERTRTRRLKAFQDKISSLQFFDPACGSGNFLTETYISLRRLENQVIAELAGAQKMLAFGDVTPVKVSLTQFHGIEINDFAVSVAQTALWIAELQANIETQSIITSVDDPLPLIGTANIRLGNALQMDWNDVLPAEQCDYIIGNPPFVGYSSLDDDQKADRRAIFGSSGGVLDYVACWYAKGADYMSANHALEAALVSTNSICQGQQVSPLWKPLFAQGVTINFAHRSFGWVSESSDAARVHVVIVGFSFTERKQKLLIDYPPTSTPVVTAPGHINAYLVAAPDAFVCRRSKPLSDVPPMIAGGKPTEGGHLLMWEDEMRELVRAEPQAEPWIRRFSMGAEFISGRKRYCLWLKGITPQELNSMPAVRERVEGVKAMREASPKVATQEKATIPWLFDEIRYDGEGVYIGVPSVSSERRQYIPMGLVTDGMIPGNMLYFIPTDSRFIFGVMMSRVHNAWMRAVAGRLEMRYRYANTIVYNNFVFPEAGEHAQQRIAELAQVVLDIRAGYDNVSLEELYDRDNDWLFPELMEAHQALDNAVERVYGLDPGLDEKDIVAHLFELYAQAVGQADS